MSTPADNETAEEIEARLRLLWNAMGVPAELQEIILHGVAEKAQVGAKVGPFINFHAERDLEADR